MKSIKRLSAILLAILLIASLSVTAFADNYPEANQATGTDFSFTKYLVFPSDANVPAITFSYSIAAGTAVPADVSAGKMAVMAGIGTPTIAANQAVFGSSDNKFTTLQDGDSLTIPTGKAYAVKTVTVSFAGIMYPEPGIYRYIVTENTTAVSGVSFDIQRDNSTTAGQRTLDVYVKDTNGTLSVWGYVFHEGLDAPSTGTNLGTTENGQTLKSTGYVNEYKLNNLTISKAVSGNQASRDKYFKFTVTVTGNSGESYPVTFNGADATVESNNATDTNYVGETNPTSIRSGEATAFYLAHDDEITIHGLPEGAKYSIVETKEDYKPTTVQTKVGAGAEGADVVVNGTTDTVTETSGMTSEHTVAYTNTRDGLVPTGVMLTVVPGVLIVVLALGGLLLLKSKKRSEA